MQEVNWERKGKVSVQGRKNSMCKGQEYSWYKEVKGSLWEEKVQKKEQ